MYSLGQMIAGCAIFLFIGCFLGIIVLGLCVAAKRQDEGFMPDMKDIEP